MSIGNRWRDHPVSDWGAIDHEEWSVPADISPDHIHEWRNRESGSLVVVVRSDGYWRARCWDARTGDGEDLEVLDAFRGKEPWWWADAPADEVFAAVKQFLEETRPV